MLLFLFTFFLPLYRFSSLFLLFFSALLLIRSYWNWSGLLFCFCRFYPAAGAAADTAIVLCLRLHLLWPSMHTQFNDEYYYE